MEQTPEEHASAKLTQYLAVAVQVAESVMRLRKQTAERAAGTDRQAAAAARAERVAQHSADRLVWQPALDRDWLATADLHDLGRAWGAANGWADTDPSADAAVRRVETRLSDLAPNAMARFDELRETGWTRTDAMSEALASVAQEAHARAAGPRIFVADSVGRTDESADRPGMHEHGAGRAAEADSRGPTRVTTPAAEPATAAQIRWAHVLVERTTTGAETTLDVSVMTRGEISELIESLGGGPRIYDRGGAPFAHRRVTDGGAPHPADVAADSHPKPFVEVTPTATHPRPPVPARTAPGRTRTLTR